MSTMLAMLLERPGSPLRLAEVRRPNPAAGEVLVEVAACGVCRTDLHVADGDLANPKLPLILGHEIVGQVAGLGAGVTGFTQGERVGIPWLGHTCGVCTYCLAGAENLCDAPGFTDTRGTAAMPNSRLPTPAIASHCQATCLILKPHRYCAPVSSDIARWSRPVTLGGSGSMASAPQPTSWRRSPDLRAAKSTSFSSPGDAAAQDFARRLGAVWAGGSDERSPTELDAAIIFASVGALVPKALRAVRKGGIVVCGGIHMSDIPAFPYATLWGERWVVSVANLTRRDARKFLALAPQVPVRTEVEVFPMAEANEALSRLRDGKLTGRRF